MQTPATLKAALDALGKPDQSLKNAIEDYGERSKENKLKQQTEGLALIKKMLDALATKEKTHQPAGIVMIADRVAAEAEKEV
jgi:hypothetical protein